MPSREYVLSKQCRIKIWDDLLAGKTGSPGPVRYGWESSGGSDPLWEALSPAYQREWEAMKRVVLHFSQASLALGMDLGRKRLE